MTELNTLDPPTVLRFVERQLEADRKGCERLLPALNPEHSQAMRAFMDDQSLRHTEILNRLKAYFDATSSQSGQDPLSASERPSKEKAPREEKLSVSHAPRVTITGKPSSDGEEMLDNTFASVQAGSPQEQAIPADQVSDPSPQCTSISRSRMGSFTFARASSFARKKKSGVDVVIVGNEASPSVGEAINDTFSMASHGSWRRKSVVGAGDVKRQSYLTFVHNEGMPTLNLDEPPELRSRFSRKSTRHDAVFHSEGQLESLLDECNVERIHDINSGEFNIFAEYKTYGEDTFTIIAANIFLKYNFVTSLCLDVACLMDFIRDVSAHYRSDNPFHNALHAADVLQTTHVYLCQRDVKENFSDVELLALLFAAMVIDVGHPGINSELLQRTNHPIATLFHDESPLESMHYMIAFALLDEPANNFLKKSPVWTIESDRDFRFLVSTLILGSDERKHASVVADVDAILCAGRIDDELITKLLTGIVHAADMSYMTKPQDIFAEWASRYMAEMYRQGDTERQLIHDLIQQQGLPTMGYDPTLYSVSKICDASNSVIELLRSVLEYVVVPFMSIMAPILPQIWAERLEFNHAFLTESEEQKQAFFEKSIRTFYNFTKPVARMMIGVPCAQSLDDLKTLGDSVQAPYAASQNANGAWVGGWTETIDEKHFFTVLSGWIARKGLFPLAPPAEEQCEINSKSPTPHERAAVAAVQAVYVMTREMLEHITALVDGFQSSLVSGDTSPANSLSGTRKWSAEEEAHNFSLAWISRLQAIENYENVPKLVQLRLSASRALQLQQQSDQHAEECWLTARAMRDETPPHPTMPNTAEVTPFNPRAPMGIAVLLTQMWWAVYNLVKDSRADQNQPSGSPRPPRPVKPGVVIGNAWVKNDKNLSGAYNSSPSLTAQARVATPHPSPVKYVLQARAISK